MQETSRRKPGARADKGRAILGAARSVFARDGYSRASIDVIAAAADVSTRTIYNHFESKEQLFATVLEASATEVATAFVENVERGVGSRPDAERDLMAIGRALAYQHTHFPEHFAMVNQIKAETPHFSPEILTRWMEAGPLRVQREIEERVQTLADAGLLDAENVPRAARHFVGLVASELTIRSFYGATADTDEQTTEIISAGVHAYLNGYAAR